jgi:LysM repeat protein
MSQTPAAEGRHLAPRDNSRLTRNFLATMPVVLVGTLAMSTLNLGGAHVENNNDANRNQNPRFDTSDLGSLASASKPSSATITTPARTQADPASEGTLSVASVAVPSTYKVRSGDTVSGIAGKYGLSTASVLALNGLSWKSLIFPGQVLKLTKTTTTTTAPASTPTAPAQTTATTTASTGTTKYTIKAGDTVTTIAKKFGVTVTAVLAANDLKVTSIIYTGRTLIIPSPSSSSTATPPATQPASTPTAPAQTTTTTGTTKYTIKAGDTVTAIAKKFGVTVAALLAANNLETSSIIYTGHTLIIPSSSSSSSTGSSTSTGTQPAQVGTAVVPLSPTMKTNAQTIIAVGQKLKVPSYGIIIALAAAAQESGLIDLTSGDRDSVGLFQQRPSTGWGTATQLLNTTYASELFYGGPSNPNKGITRGLLDIPGWQSMTLTQAAQAVQISATPTAYAKWQTSATAWYAALT